MADALSCPLTSQYDDTYDDGSRTGAFLRIFDCTRKKQRLFYADFDTKCGGMVKEVEVKKGVLTDLKFVKNGYSIMAQSFDRGTCFSWRSENGCEIRCGSWSAVVLSYDSKTSSDVENVVRIDVKPKYSGKLRSCLLNDDPEEEGVADKIAVDVYNCTNNGYSNRNEKCNMIKKGVVLRKDQLVNLNYDVNDYAVMLKFYGRDLCASCREYNVNYTFYRCHIECENMFDKGGDDPGVVYRSYERVVKYPIKYLKFVNVTNFTENDGKMLKQNPFFLLMVFVCTVTFLINLF